MILLMPDDFTCQESLWVGKGLNSTYICLYMYVFSPFPYFTLSTMPAILLIVKGEPLGGKGLSSKSDFSK